MSVEILGNVNYGEANATWGGYIWGVVMKRYGQVIFNKIKSGYADSNTITFL